MRRRTHLTSAVSIALATAMLSGCAVVEGVSEEPTTRPLASAAPSQTTTTLPAIDERRAVILDYSPTVSDIGALAFLASRPELRLIGVTLPGTGESFCEPGVVHTRGVLVTLGLDDVPVACGPEDPITGWGAFPTSWRFASSEMNLPTAAPNETRPAPELLADLIIASNQPVEVVAVGPLTNLALAMEAHQEIVTNIAAITIMGGAIDVPGNVIRNDVGEWNVWVDPTAAGRVLAADVPVTLVPLDATNDLPTGRIFWESLDANATTQAARLVRDVWLESGVWIDNPGGYYFWDELAAAILVDESLVTFATHRLVVDDETRDNKGWTRQDPSGAEVRVALSADRRAFEQLFVDTLVGAPTALGYRDATTQEIAYLEALEAIEAETTAAMDTIFQETAADMDLTEDDTYFVVLGAAVSRIIAGPWVERLRALDALEVPAALAGDHQTYVASLTAFMTGADQLIDALIASDEAALEAILTPLTQSCSALQDAADARLMDVDLGCT